MVRSPPLMVRLCDDHTARVCRKEEVMVRLVKRFRRQEVPHPHNPTIRKFHLWEESPDGSGHYVKDEKSEEFCYERREGDEPEETT